MSILTGPWSYSRASACARALYMGKVLKAPPEPRPERFLEIDRRDLGTVLHLGAETMIRAMIKSRPREDADALALRLLATEEGDLRPFAPLAPAITDIARSLDRFYARFRMQDFEDVETRDAWVRDHCLDSEWKLAVDADGRSCAFDACPESGWRGIIDYAEVDGETLTIIDFKNRPAIFADSELRVDEQLSGYHDLARAQAPSRIKNNVLGIYYFEYGHTQTLSLDDQQIADNVARLRSRARAKESLALDQIGPEPGYGKCQYCDYLNSCQAGREYIAGAPLTPTDRDQARQTAAWVLVQEEKLKAAKDALKAFTGEFGAVDIDDKTSLGYSRPREGVVYDPELSLRILKQLIVEGHVKAKLHDFVSLDVEAVKKAARDKVVYEALAPARSPKTSVKFEFFKPVKNEAVTVVKEGLKTVAAPVVVEQQPARKTRARVKGGGS